MIFVLGFDGYIGNALTQRLLSEGYDVIGVDNMWRRKWIENDMKSDSATPILPIEEKSGKFHKIYDGDFKFSYFDIEEYSDKLDFFIEMYKPEAIFNLAHNPSAPYSMMSKDKANKVLSNNILGTNNVLWSMMKHCPDCHYITIGSIGEYDHYSNIDIEEGYFSLEHKGRKSNKMMFPRRPGSIYHSSKVASTYLIDYLTRAWNLSCTDVMQGVVFGMYTPEIDDTKIYSRFDSDEAGGTVINRFIIQSILGIPLTIYGNGEHQRSFLSLNDSIQALMIAFNNPAKKGEVQTWNQLSEWHSMNDIAEMVVETGKKTGLNVSKQWIDTPRSEYTGKHYYNFVTENLTSKGYQPSRKIKEEIEYCFKVLMPYKEKIERLRKVVMPKIKFKS